MEKIHTTLISQTYMISWEEIKVRIVWYVKASEDLLLCEKCFFFFFQAEDGIRDGFS